MRSSAVMDIALLIHHYFHHGGQQDNCRRLAEELLRRGHRVTLYTARCQCAPPRGVQLVTLPERAYSNHRRMWQFATDVQAHLPQHDFTLAFVRVPGVEAYYAADLCQCWRMQQRRAGRVLAYLPRYRTQLAQEAALFSPQAHTQYLMLTPTTGAGYQHCYPLPAERWHLLPPGMNPLFKQLTDSTARRTALRQHLALQDDDILLLAVGSGFRTKGLDRSLQALRHLPDALRRRCRLFVLGRDRFWLWRGIAQRFALQRQVHFVGLQANVADWMLAADLLLHPARQESAGNVLLEAMACGLPVLASANCGYAFHVKQAGGGMVLPDPLTLHDYSQHIAHMVQADRRSWQRQGRAYLAQQGEHWYARHGFIADWIEREGLSIRAQRPSGKCVLDRLPSCAG